MKLDIGCGPNPAEGFEGVDQYPFDGKVKHVMDVRKGLGFEDSSVEEIRCIHFLEHLGAVERTRFLNECWRVMKPGAKMTLVTPHWASHRAYGDPTHQWPPVSEMFFYYLSREWRVKEAPHTDAGTWGDGYSCDFEATWGYAPNPALAGRSQEFGQFAFQFYKEAALDTHATLTVRKPEATIKA